MRFLVYLVFCCFTAISCDTLPGVTPLDEERNVLRNLAISPNTILHVDGTPPRDTTITFTLSVQSIQGVLDQSPRFNVFLNNQQVKQFSDTLRNFDAATSTYSGSYTTTFSNRQTRSYDFFVFSQTKTGLLTNTLQRSITINGLPSEPPILLSAQNPDEIVIPAEGQTISFDCIAKVTHPYGQDQIEVVLLDLIDQNGIKLGNQSYQLFDDGQTATNGDAVAGDSLFTRRFSITGNQQPDNITVYYFARDRYGLFSDTLTRTLTIRR